MKFIFFLPLLSVGCLCSGWSGQAGTPGGNHGWGGQGTSGGRGQAGEAPGPRGAWGQGGGAPGAWARSGRSPDGQQYGATIIDTPDQYGYEANIPGAHSKFVGYRTGRSGGPEAQQRASGHGGWAQPGGHQKQW